MPHSLILSIGSDPRILDTRELILRSAGYPVVSAVSIREAVYLLKDSDFDAVILCHSLPIKDCERLISAVRASGSRIPIGCVSGGAPIETSSFADGLLDKEPVAFLQDLERLLDRSGQLPSIAATGWSSEGDVNSGRKPPKCSTSSATVNATGNDEQTPKSEFDFPERKKA